MNIGTKGFTLIELLVSMTLLSLVMMLGTWSFSIFTSKWDGRLGYFAKHVSTSKDLILLNEAISSVTPFITNINNRPNYYFTGDPLELVAVNQNPIFNIGSPVFFKLSIETTQDNKKFLLYQEKKLADNSGVENIIYTHEKILIEESSNISFDYYGWENAQVKMRAEDKLTNGNITEPKWYKSFNAASNNLMPIAIRINWDNSYVEIPLINDQGTWLTLINLSGLDNE